MTRSARLLGKAGRGLIVVALAISVYNVATAQDPGREAARAGGGARGRVRRLRRRRSGGRAGLAGPGPRSRGRGAFVGGVIFALGADLAFDDLWN